LKPGGNFSLSIGISLAAVTVIFPGIGANFELAISGPIPCFHAGAGAGAAATGAGAASALGGGAVAQPCRIISDKASVENVAAEISRWLMVISVLFNKIVNSVNLNPLDAYGYSLELGFCPIQGKYIGPVAHF
jgi:hypothetical protein